jgi:glucokinase
MKYALGVDIGGTKTSVVLGSSQGKILARKLLLTRTGKKTRQGIEETVQALKALKSGPGKGKRLLGVGVGIPGPMDSRNGVVQRSPHLGGWKGFPLKSFLERRLGLSVFINNDANAAALGEKVFGEGKRAGDFVYMTISTGIGGGVVVNGELVHGTSFVGGEVGHMTIVPDGERCKCGKRGCLEAYASGTAIARFAKKRNALEAGLAARKGSRSALAAYEQGGYYLGIGIANLLNILNPKVVVLGGGVLKSAPRIFWSSMLKSCKRNAWPQAYRAVRIVKTKLNDRVGDLGALALVFARKQ